MTTSSFVFGAAAVLIGAGAVALFYEYNKKNMVTPPPSVPFLNPFEVYVSLNGDDVNGTGSSQAPFATLEKALATIAPRVSPTQRGVVIVSPGTYTAPAGGWVLPPNVFVEGHGLLNTRLVGNWSMGTGFSAAGDHRGGWKGVNLRGLVDGDMATVASNEGKLYIRQCQLYNPGGAVAAAFHGASTITQVIIHDCDSFGDLEFYGCNAQMNNCIMQGGSLKLSDKGTLRGLFQQAGGLRRDTRVEALTSTVAAEFYGNAAAGSSLTLAGAGVTVQASLSALPPKASTTVSDGAALTAVTLTDDPLWLPAV